MHTINDKALELAIETRIRSDFENYNINGVSVAVLQKDEIKYKRHFGVMNAKNRPVSDDTLFRLASMTKPITAVATMILVDRGLLSLEDTVEKFYPAFSNLKVANSDDVIDAKISIRKILTHSSGIASSIAWAESCKSITPSDVASVDAFVEFISRQPLSFVPGTKQEYSGVGAFSVLTGIIQKVAGMPFESFLQKEIFEPCNMVDTTFTPSKDQWSRVTDMHTKLEFGNGVDAMYDGCVFEWYPAHNYLGGAGLISSMNDYLNFARMLLGGGIFEGKRIVSEEAVKEISTPQVYNMENEWWGLGVRVIHGEKDGSLPVGCFGWSGAYGTHFWIDPSNQIIGLYMKNSRHDGGSGAITARNFEIDVYSALK